MMEMDRQTQQIQTGTDGRPCGGWELRCVPSTWRSATLGGLYGGGFGGVGSINYGPLAATGNVLGVKAMTIEPEPKTVELRAPEALLLHHVYGTNGLVLELEVGLAPAFPWLEAIVCFDRFEACDERRGVRRVIAILEHQFDVRPHFCVRCTGRRGPWDDGLGKCCDQFPLFFVENLDF